MDMYLDAGVHRALKNRTKRKWITLFCFSILLALGAFCATSVAFTPCAAYAADWKTILTNNYSRAKSLAGVSSFNGWCGKAVGYELYAYGITSGKESLGNGVDAASYFKNKSKTSGGYNVYYSGGSRTGGWAAFDKATNSGNTNGVYVVSYTSTTASAGHVSFIAIEGGSVFVAETYKYNGTPEGRAMQFSYSDFKSRWGKTYKNVTGVVRFDKGHTHSYTTVTGYKYKSYNTHSVTKKCSCGATQTVDEACSFAPKGDKSACAKCGKEGQPYGSNKVVTSIDGSTTLFAYIGAKKNKNLVVDVCDASSAYGANVWLYSLNKSKAQHFQLVKREGGSFSIACWLDGGRLVEVKDASASDYANVQMGTYNPTHHNKRWYLEKTPDGYYSFRNVHTNKYLDMAGGGPYEKQNLIQYAGNGTDAQKFVLTPISVADATVSGVVDKQFTGSAHTQNVSVKINDRVLAKDADYSVSYSNNVDPGTATVTITGKGGYVGTKKVTFNITGKKLSGKPAVAIPEGDYIIASAVGSQTRVLDVEAGGSANEQNVQIWKNHVNPSHPDSEIFHIAGNATGHGITLKATGKGVHTKSDAAGDQNVHQWAGANVNYGSSWIFEDAGGGWYYIRNKHGYYLDVVNGKDADGTNVRVYIFNGSNAQKWKLLPAGSIASTSITLSPNSYTYDGTAKKPSVTVKNGSTVLVDGTNYTVTYANNVNVGTAKVTVIGMGGFRATEKTVTFKINPAPTPTPTPVTVDVSSVSLNKSSLSIQEGSTASLVATVSPSNATNRTVSWKSNNTSVATVDSSGRVTAVKPGTATVTATAGGKSAACAITVTPKQSVPVVTTATDINKVNCYGITGSYKWTGKPITPEPTIHNSDRYLNEGRDYTVSYSNNVDVGTAKATIRGIGEFTGIRTFTFKIYKDEIWQRLWGTTEFDTMARIVQTGWSGTGGTVVVATGAGYWDALSASGVAGVYGAPVLITDKGRLSGQTRAELSRLRPSRVIVAGGPNAVADSVLAAIRSTTGVTPVRTYGLTATDTAAALNLKYFKGRTDTAILATSKDFYDALSAAPVSYAKRYPIFLAEDKNTVSRNTLSAMKACGIKKVIVAGGTAVVSDELVRALGNNGITLAKRLWGTTHYDTSQAIASWAIANGMVAEKMGVATSYNYYDALTGAALCGKNNAVLVLADRLDSGNVSVASANKMSIFKGFVFGGEKAVEKQVFDAFVSSTR